MHSQVLGGIVPPLTRPVPRELDELRLRLLEPDPKRRIQRADEALEILGRYPGYRDRRIELAQVCGSMTGVQRPRTGPGTGSRNNVIPAARPATPAPAAHPNPATAPQPAAPSPTVVMDGGMAVPQQPGAPREATIALADGGLPPGVAPAQPAMVQPRSLADEPTSTSTGQRPREATSPELYGQEPIEPSMTRFATARSGLPVWAMLLIGVLAVAGGGTVAGLIVAQAMGDKGDKDDDEKVAAAEPGAGDAAKPEDAVPEPDPAPAPVAAGPVIGEDPAEPEAGPEIPTAVEAEAPAAEPETPPTEPETPPAESPPPVETKTPKAPAAEPEPAPKTRSRAKSRSGSGCKAGEGSPVLVHFRLDGIDQAWVKVGGREFALTPRADSTIKPGCYRLRWKREKSDSWKRGPSVTLATDHEWVIQVGSGGPKTKDLRNVLGK